MRYDIKLSSGSEGWSAITRIPLGTDGKRILRIRTAKSQTSRTLVSAATVWHVGALGESHAMGFGGPTGDFTAHVVSSAQVRVTQALVQHQHEAALNHVPQVLLAIDKHYADQAAKAAEKASEASPRSTVQAAHQAAQAAMPGQQHAAAP
jgi:hypothetical protein